jgi:hypothetical protein
MELELELWCCPIFKKVFLTLHFLIFRKKVFAKVFIFYFFSKKSSQISQVYITQKNFQNFPIFLV